MLPKGIHRVKGNYGWGCEGKLHHHHFCACRAPSGKSDGTDFLKWVELAWSTLRYEEQLIYTVTMWLDICTSPSWLHFIYHMYKQMCIQGFFVFLCAPWKKIANNLCFLPCTEVLCRKFKLGSQMGMDWMVLQMLLNCNFHHSSLISALGCVGMMVFIVQNTWRATCSPPLPW